MASADFRNALAKLIFHNLPIPNVGDFPGLQPSAIAGELFIALHTEDPTLAGKQSSNEVSVQTWPTYARVSLNRTPSRWQIVGNLISNIGEIRFPQMVGGTNTVIKFYSIGMKQIGDTEMITYGAINPWKTATNGTALLFDSGDLDIQVL